MSDKRVCRTSIINVVCVSLLIIQITWALPPNRGATSSSQNENSNQYPQKKAKQDIDGDGEGGIEGIGESIAGGIVDIDGLVGGDGDAAPGAQYLYGTYTNVGQILSGVVNRNISNILVGGTNFIPPGGLRTSVDFLIQQAVIPTVQRVFTDVGQTIQTGRNDTVENTPINAFVPAAAASAAGAVPDTSRVPNQPRIENVIQSGSVSASGTQQQQQASTSDNSANSESFFSNPLKAIQNRIQNRLQGLQNLIPSFNFGGSTNNNANANVNSNAANTNANSNRYRQGIPSSPATD